MQVLFYADEPDPRTWADALRARLPGAQVHQWTPDTAPECDYAVCWKPPAAFFAGQPRLKAILNIGAGADAIIHAAGLPQGVPVIRLDDAGMAAQMQAFVAACALRYCRRLDEYQRQQASAHWERLPPRGPAQFPVGVMGLGVLGAGVGGYLRGMGFPVRGWRRLPAAVAGVECFSGDAELDAFLAGTMMLVCLLPLTARTRGILNRATLAKLPRGAYLVNIARGGHLIDTDLLDLLDDGHLAAATLDVFDAEPLSPDSRLWRHPRVTITPHISAMTLIDAAMEQIAGKIDALERGLAVAGVIDPAREY